MEERGTVVGGHGTGVVEGGGAWNDPVSVSSFCLCSVSLLLSKLILQEAGPAGMFPVGGISRINQANPLSLPPGEDSRP